ncbi:hypothetical protein R3I93_008573 [Phoxinus phoxinus]
MRFTEH